MESERSIPSNYNITDSGDQDDTDQTKPFPPLAGSLTGYAFELLWFALPVYPPRNKVINRPDAERERYPPDQRH
jgi:hypothetical protein